MKNTADKIFTADDLRTETGRQMYYHYWYDVPSSLVEKQAPSLMNDSIEYINRELAKIGGTVNGVPRFRAVWGGTEPEIKYWEDSNNKTHEYVGKKYPEMRSRRTIGYYYMKSGKRAYTTDKRKVPKGKVAVPDEQVYQLGKLLWVVEMKFTAEDLVNAGWLPPPDSDRAKDFCIKNGQRYRKPFDPDGEYLECFKCTFDFKPTPDSLLVQFYRDVTMEDVERVKAIWQRSQSETDREFVARVKIRQRKIDGVKKFNQLYDMKVTVQDEVDRLERIKNMATRGTNVPLRTII